MANEIRIRTSLELLQDVGGSAGVQEGITYTNLQHDGNADSRSWGGKYNTLTVYTDADVAYWSQVVVTDTNGTNGIEDSAWTEASAVTDGTLPTTAYVVAVEYTGELGTVGNVTVKVSAEIFAVLDLGEAIVIPLAFGEALTDIYVYAGAYSNGVNEATVNVVVAGT